MAQLDVVRIADALPALPLAELRRLSAAVADAIAAKQAALAAAWDAPRPCCPFCRAATPHRWGKSGDTQRWRCRACRKTFTAITGHPLAFAKRRDALLAVALDLLGDQPRSCRKLAKALGVHWMTVWRWRIRLLHAVRDFGDLALAGLVEADETFFRESRKGSREWALFNKGQGPAPPRPRWRDFDRRREKLSRGLSRWQIPVLVLRDRHGGTCARRLPGLDLAAFEPVLDQALAPDAMLCTDGGAVYRRWAKRRSRAVEQVNTRQGVRVRDGVFHIQNANAFHSRFKDFMRPFRGPSTRYLPLYVGWMVFRDQQRGKERVGNPLIERLIGVGRQPDTTRRQLPPLVAPGRFNKLA